MSTPDQLLHTRLSTTATVLASERGLISHAVDELRQLAGGRTDLLTQAAGTLGGAWSADPSAYDGDHPIGAGLLLYAGGDGLAVAEWIDVVRARVLAPRRGI